MISKNFLLKKIKQKKELLDVDNSLILEILNSYLTKHNINLNVLKPPQLKIIVKEIRSQLRLYTGRFQKSSKNRLKLLNQNNLSDLLKTHTSTAERLKYYPKLKNRIKDLKVKSILDLACGLNPIALASPDLMYLASDIKEDELKLIKSFFIKKRIPGKVFVYNLKNPNKKLPKADLCLLFKILDIIETKSHKLAEKIIKKLNCKHILISFSTTTLSGKPMQHPRRFWLENLLSHLELKFETFSSTNEIFYLVEKSTSDQYSI